MGNRKPYRLDARREAYNLDRVYIADAARICNVHAVTIQRWIASGTLEVRDERREGRQLLTIGLPSLARKAYTADILRERLRALLWPEGEPSA